MLYLAGEDLVSKRQDLRRCGKGLAAFYFVDSKPPNGDSFLFLWTRLFCRWLRRMQSRAVRTCGAKPFVYLISYVLTLQYPVLARLGQIFSSLSHDFFSS